MPVLLLLHKTSSMTGEKEVRSPSLHVEFYRKEILPNGLTLLTEKIPHVKSASIGVWSKIGSRHEPMSWRVSPTSWSTCSSKERKGDPRRISRRAIDSVGGTLDAFTTQEGIPASMRKCWASISLSSGSAFGPPLVFP